VAAFLEATFTTFPLVFLILLIISIILKKTFIFPIAFFMGLLLDALSVRDIGSESIFFLVFLFLVFLYQKKFEIDTLPFVFLSSFLGSFLYLIFSNTHNFLVLQSLVCGFLALIFFKVFKIFI
jgi:cell shape-determining protein MreD